MSSIYRSSKIALEIPWDDKISQGLSLRTYEVMAAGSCLFAYDIRKDMAKTFTPGKEYIPFSNEEELKEKIKTYLGNERERESIAKAGYKTVVSNHSFVKRMQEIIDTVHSFLKN